MAYIGRGLDKLSNVDVLDAITFTNSAGPYNITKSSTAFIPSAIQNLLIEVDGVIQASDSYTISGSTITFGVSMSSSLTMNSFLHFGMGVSMTPTDGSVSTAKIVDDAVTTSKILDNNVTVAKLPTTLNISGNTVTLPASVSGLGTGITNAQLAGSIDVTSKITGVVPSANLGSGTGSSANFLRGDSSWQEVATGTSWQTVVTASTLTAVAGRGYPINTTSNACTVTLPASASVGDTIEFTDYARNWGTNAVTINPNSLKFQGYTTPQPVYDTNGESISITYMDATKGWIPTNDGAVVNETPQYYTIDFLVIGGGGGGATGANSPYNRAGGGGGAGGYRNSYASEASGGGGSSETPITDIDAGVVLTIDVGGGGAGGNGASAAGSIGLESSIKGTGVSITSNGGGYGAEAGVAGGAGSSGGGGGATNGTTSGGAGTSNQGYAGEGGAGNVGGGGGGAAEIGGTDGAGEGGDGLSSSITGFAINRGGGGGAYNSGSNDGGTGGGGNSSGTNGSPAATVGTVNTGGGGGGSENEGANPDAADGGSGVVILRMPDGKYSSTTTGSPTVTTGVGGTDTVLIFNGDGSYTT